MAEDRCTRCGHSRKEHEDGVGCFSSEILPYCACPRFVETRDATDLICSEYDRLRVTDDISVRQMLPWIRAVTDLLAKKG